MDGNNQDKWETQQGKDGQHRVITWQATESSPISCNSCFTFMYTG